ncbi:hypothetical protein BSKO_01107 [Bryopsis sp. KO-2023]|nr:hypothetical protein BSKO_01107 [Bryopsis sp. KO-2023]
MSNGEAYDLIVVGAGSAGTRAARWTASNYPGTKVAIVELPFGFVSSDEVGGAGGTCVIRGCVPKKLLVYGSEFSHYYQEGVGFGWGETAPPHDWTVLMAKKAKEVERLNNVYNNLLDKAGVERLEGKGKLVDANTVHVALAAGGERLLQGKHIVVATGGRAVVPDIPGKEHGKTSDHALALENLAPGSDVVVVGGGYIAVEFAGIFNGLGAKVHLMYRRPKPLRGFDEECRDQVAENLAASGITVHPECSPKELVENEDGTYTYHYTSPAGDGSINASFVMFATGRKPNSENLGLEDVGIEVDKTGAIVVDEVSRTNVPSVYALGDITNRMNLTPVAIMEAMALSKTIFGKEPTRPDYDHVASAVFCQPPLATVGWSEEEAIQNLAGNIDVYVSKFKPMKMSFSEHPVKTLTKIIVDADSDKVVGVQMVGVDSAEIMQGIAIALKAGATKKTFDSTVGIHPSSAEEFVSMRSKARTVQGKGTAKL